MSFLIKKNMMVFYKMSFLLSAFLPHFQGHPGKPGRPGERGVAGPQVSIDLLSVI